jgi:hypothetical protein
LALEFVTVGALTYIGYSGLRSPPSTGGLLARMLDALMVALWSYCVFSIVMWFVFVVAAWLQRLGRRF